MIGDSFTLELQRATDEFEDIRDNEAELSKLAVIGCALVRRALAVHRERGRNLMGQLAHYAWNMFNNPQLDERAILKYIASAPGVDDDIDPASALGSTYRQIGTLPVTTQAEQPPLPSAGGATAFGTPVAIPGSFGGAFADAFDTK